MSDYLPFEYVLHAFVFMSSCFIQQYVLAVYCLPLMLYHAKMYKTKAYRHHFFSRAEYKPTQTKVVRIIHLKTVYYIGLLCIVSSSFIYASSNFLLYHLTGNTYSLPTFLTHLPGMGIIA